MAGRCEGYFVDYAVAQVECGRGWSLDLRSEERSGAKSKGVSFTFSCRFAPAFLRSSSILTLLSASLSSLVSGFFLLIVCSLSFCSLIVLLLR